MNKSVAVIQNTIRDAIDTYRALTLDSNKNWQFVAGPMLPAHKQSRIKEIRTKLKSDMQKTGVVCTQVLEAGVNLSFREIFRAFAYFSSIGQAAGRSNRHGEGRAYRVTVFRFVREDSKESAQFVYKDLILSKNTKTILEQFPNLSEENLGEALAQFYKQSWAENPRMTG